MISSDILSTECTVDADIYGAELARAPPAAPAAAPSDACPCIIQSKKGSQGGKVCGRKIKANGRCGIHQKTCVLPEAAGAPESKETPEAEPVEEVVEIRPQGTCPCIIQTKKAGQAGKVCGRKIKANGRCGIHQKTCITKAAAAPVAAKETCACITAEGRPCGRVVTKNARCAVHQKKCTLKSPPKTKILPAPEADLDELARDLEDAFEDEQEVQVEGARAGAAPDLEPVDDVAGPVNTSWTTRVVEDPREVSDLIDQLKNESVDLLQMRALKQRIVRILEME